MSKYCAKCNQFVNDEDAFCPNCGSAEFFEAVEENAFEQPVKKGFFKKIGSKLLYIGLPIAVVVGLVWANIQPIWGFFVKTFGSGEQYLKYTAGVAVTDSIDEMTDVYDQFFFNPENQSVEATLSVNVNDDIASLAGGLVDSDTSKVIDTAISTLNESQVKMFVNTKGDRTEVEYGLVLDGDDFVNAYVMADRKEGMAYIKLDGLTDEVLAIDMNEAMEMAGVPYDFEEIMEIKDELLPKPKTVNKLIKKYLGAAIGGIQDVEKDSDKVKIEGVQQKFTVLTIPCSEEQLLNMVIPVLEEAEKDKDIKKIVENAQEVLVDHDIIDEDDLPDDVYELFTDAIGMALDEVEDLEVSDEEVAEVKLYINGASEIKGISVDVAGQNMFSWINVEKGKKVATEISIPALSYAVFGAPDTFVGIKGEGTKKGNKINAEYNVIIDDASYATIEVKDYNQKQAKKGYINGTFRIMPTAELYEIIADEAGIDEISMIKSLEPYFEISLENSKKKSNMKVAVGADGDEYVSISLDAKISGAKRIKDVDADYEIDEAEEWASTIDVDKLEKKLEKTSIGKLFLGRSKSYDTETIYEEELVIGNDYY